MTRFRRLRHRADISSSTPNRFTAHEDGSVILLTAFAIFALISIAGAAIDLGTQQLVKNKLQEATDIAALAAARLPATSTLEGRQAVAQRYFMLNYPADYMNTARPTPTVSIQGDMLNVTTGTVQVPTMFMMVGDKNETIAMTSSSVMIAREEGGTVYDMILVFDNSHSMSAIDAGGIESRLDSVKDAASILTDNLLGEAEGNRMAAITWDTEVLEVQPFTENEATMQNFVGAMLPSVETGTNSTAGLINALAMNKDVRDDDQKNDVVKVVILLTDGANTNTIENNGGSMLVSNNLKEAGFLVYTIAFGQTVMNDACKYYVPGQGGRRATPTEELDPRYCPKPFLANVASGGHTRLLDGSYENQSVYFYIAPTEEELTKAFQTILANIRKLRVTG